MKRLCRKQKYGVVALAVLFIALTFVLLKPVALPPSVSVDVLGYTNRVGPYALLAITNRSASAIRLDLTCLVSYSPGQGPGPHRVTSVEAHIFRMTRLLPQEGFVQEVFVFPAPRSEWQVEYRAAYSSAWLETRRFAENWLPKRIQASQYLLTSKAWRKFGTEWFACPP